MVLRTPVRSLPYVEPSDTVVSYPTVSSELATKLDGTSWVVAPTPYAGSSNAYASPFKACSVTIGPYAYATVYLAVAYTLVSGMSATTVAAEAGFWLNGAEQYNRAVVSGGGNGTNTVTMAFSTNLAANTQHILDLYIRLLAGTGPVTTAADSMTNRIAALIAPK